jgi:hypothetical protein
MLRGSEKHASRHNAPHDRRHTVLGYWHELKLQLYEQAVDRGLLDAHNRSGGKRHVDGS